MSSHELFISSPRCTCADASDYVRSLLCATLLVGSVAVQCKSLTSFITQASKPSLDLFPRKCTFAKVIDLRNMVLWSIGFIANRYRIPPHQISLCPLLIGTFVNKDTTSNETIISSVWSISWVIEDAKSEEFLMWYFDFPIRGFSRKDNSLARP